MKEQLKKLSKAEIKLGKYRLGVPITSDSYKKPTPQIMRKIGDSLLFAGSVISIIAASFAMPPVIIVIGSVAALAGKFVTNSLSE